MSTRKAIIKKTIEVGWFTLMSRFFGIIREMLMVRYLGAGPISDAFLTAFKVPNSLRKIFAEGALSAAFVPFVVRKVSSGQKDSLRGIMSLAFLIFEGIVLFLCALAIWFAPELIRIIAPGFNEIQIAYAVSCLQILMPFIFFLSSSALIAGPLQAVGHFFVPAFSPVLLNIVFITGIALCLFFNLQVQALCGFILFGGFVQLLAHLMAYMKLEFGFGAIERHQIREFLPILGRFGLSLMSMSIMEINLFIDTSFASLLPPGSVSLLYYANRFMGIPLGVFAVALSTVLLPHFSRICHETPARMSFYIFESAKLVFWIAIPAACMMSFFANDIFITLFLSKKFTLGQAFQAGSLLSIFLIGLFFFSINKILLNVYYALHVAWLPAVIATGACILNVVLDVLLVYQLGAIGLAFATVIAGIFQTIVFLFVLNRFFSIRLYGKRFAQFAMRYAVQIAVCFAPVVLLYFSLSKVLIVWHVHAHHLLFETVFLWCWVGPLCAAVAIALFATRRYFGIQLHFID